MKIGALLFLVASLVVSVGGVVVHAAETADTRDEEQYIQDMQQFKGKPLKVFTKCDLRAAPLDCQEVIRDFFIAYGKYFEQVTSPAEAQIQFQLTDERASNTEVLFHFSFDGDPLLSVSDFSYAVKVDTTVIDSVALLNLTLKSIARGLSVYLTVVSASQEDSGLTVVYNTAGAAGPGAKKTYDGPFYFDVGLNASGSHSQTNASSNSSASGLLNYSGDKLGFRVNLSAYQNKTTIPTETGPLTGKNTEVYGSAIGFYSFKKRWSVALAVSEYAAPAQNVSGEQEAAVGVEWNLVPYRINETREIYFRVGTGLRDLDLELQNDLGFNRETYHFLFAQVYANWALLNSKANISISGSSTLYSKYMDYSRIRGSVNASYQITRAIRISGGYNLSFSKKSLTFPQSPDYSNPINSMYLGGAAGVSTGFNIGVSVTLGNSLKRTRDRRWSGF